MNIEELKQVGEILATLSGNAYQGYVLWVGSNLLSDIVTVAGWCLFAFMLYKIANKIIETIKENGDGYEEAKRLRREIEKTRGELIASIGWDVYKNFEGISEAAEHIRKNCTVVKK